MTASTAYGIALGYLADRVFADPRNHHPVAVFGSLATRCERSAYADSRARGVLFCASLVGGAALLGAGLQACAREPWQRTGVTALATWAVVGGRSLEKEGVEMAERLECADATNDLTPARQRLSHLCSRDATDLTGDELARATVESLAENTSDAVTGAVFWGAVAGVPGLLAFRAANTLDAMVGYRNARYRRFGWASARLDDVVNLAPAVLTSGVTVLVAPFFGGRAAAGEAVRAWFCDAAAHPSPNAGQVEATAAGALGVSLGGTNTYDGQRETRGALGSGPSPTVADVRRAVALTRAVAGACVAACCVIAWNTPPWRTSVRARSGHQLTR